MKSDFRNTPIRAENILLLRVTHRVTRKNHVFVARPSASGDLGVMELQLDADGLDVELIEKWESSAALLAAQPSAARRKALECLAREGA